GAGLRGRARRHDDGDRSGGVRALARTSDGRDRDRDAIVGHMATVSQVLTGLVAALHVYFLVLEMFLWTTPTGQRVFGRTAAEQESSKVLAANQGLYHGFLAAGLMWSLVAGAPLASPVRVFFLACVVVA